MLDIMEGIQKVFRSATPQDSNTTFRSISAALEKAPIKSSPSASSADHSQLLLTRSSNSSVDPAHNYFSDSLRHRPFQSEEGKEHMPHVRNHYTMQEKMIN
ncbi:putative respiratory burst oxidase -like protein E-like isoform X1 [Capsicum annuum]|nr:putative respiratory burst oxidase -like protein E-like isoform X1 [Capsicum annuum]